MKAMMLLIIGAAALIFASPTSASVISASSQTARSKTADRVDHLSVTTIQNDLNASMHAASVAAVPTALAAQSAPATSGGFLLATDPGSASGFQDRGDNSTEWLLAGGAVGTLLVLAMALGDEDSGGAPVGDASRVTWDPGRGGGGGGGGVHATPEPSTWLLLGAGLVMVGALEAIRRNAA